MWSRTFRRIQSRVGLVVNWRAACQLPRISFGKQNWQARSSLRGRITSNFRPLRTNDRKGKSPPIGTSRKTTWTFYVLCFKTTRLRRRFPLDFPIFGLTLMTSIPKNGPITWWICSFAQFFFFLVRPPSLLFIFLETYDWLFFLYKLGSENIKKKSKRNTDKNIDTFISW